MWAHFGLFIPVRVTLSDEHIGEKKKKKKYNERKMGNDGLGNILYYRFEFYKLYNVLLERFFD
jgi:hypothetical protein